MKSYELLDNSWDIGTISGVLRGIELTTTLLPNQKEAVANARKAIERIQERNQKTLKKLAHTNPPNDPKLSHGAKNCKRGFAANRQIKEQPPLAPALC